MITFAQLGMLLQQGNGIDSPQRILVAALLLLLGLVIGISKLNPAVRRKVGLSLLGAMLGGVTGFLLRPAVPFVGQLPFSVVITRGATLTDINQLLIPMAESSCNYLIIGIIMGTICGIIGEYIMTKK